MAAWCPKSSSPFPGTEQWPWPGRSTRPEPAAACVHVLSCTLLPSSSDMDTSRRCVWTWTCRVHNRTCPSSAVRRSASSPEQICISHRVAVHRPPPSNHVCMGLCLQAALLPRVCWLSRQLIPRCFNTYSSILCSDTWECKSSSSVLQNCLHYLGPFIFPYTFCNQLDNLNTHSKPARIFIWIVLNV